MKQWPTKTLGEISDGGQYGLNAAAMSEGTGVRFIRITDITQAGELRHEEPAFVPEGTTELDDYELKDGDVLIARSGATAGKSYVHHSFGERAVFAGYLIRFQPDTAKVLPRFIGAFLQTPAYWKQLNSHKRAVAQPNVNAKQLASLTLPVPPLAEQERIVKLLDEADELRKLRAQADHRAADLIPDVFHEMFGDPATNPKGWPIVPLVEITSPKQWPTITQEQLTESGFPVYGANGRIGFYSEFNHTERTVLVTCRGATCGTINVCEPKSYVTGNAMSLDDPNPELLNVSYLESILRVRGVNDTITGSAQPQITRQSLARVSFPIPPLPLQNEFAKRVTEIRELEASQATSRTRLDALFQSMLHRAFNEEL